MEPTPHEPRVNTHPRPPAKTRRKKAASTESAHTHTRARAAPRSHVTHPTHATHAAHPKKQTHPRKKTEKSKKKWNAKKIILISVVSFLLLGGAAYFLYDRYTYESTDDAMVTAHTTMLAPKVSGIVTQVLIDEHQHVKAGEVLVRLEQKDYLAALSNVRANLQAIQVQAANARRDFNRAVALYRDHAITHQNYDHALASFQDFDRQAKAAQASVDQAELNLEYTTLRAPTDGFVSRKSVEVGMNATAGTVLVGFVQTDERWITANFKETQLDSIKIGKTVKVSVDAIPDRKYEGLVESISPSSGATFTLFPPDNATGNFTKVVQRVPVKIYLKNLNEDDLKRLQAGLSAEVDIIKHSDIEAIPAHPTANYVSQVAQSLPESPRSPAETRLPTALDEHPKALDTSR